MTPASPAPPGAPPPGPGVGRLLRRGGVAPPTPAARGAARGAPPLDPELERLLRRMRLPYIRNAAPELLATAKAQRWDPAEVLKALLVEEVSGRDRSALATRRARAG